MDFFIQDVVMYALEHNLLGAVKYALKSQQQDGSNELSTLCQTRLVIATMPRSNVKQSSAAQFINGEEILAFSQMLRSLKFIRSNWKKAGGFKHFAFCTIKLQKVILMHMICLASKSSIVKEQLEEGFGQDAVNHLISVSNNERLVSILKREINGFRQLCENLLKEESKKLKYIQNQMWVDFNKDFWKSLDDDLTAYIELVQSTFPALKLGKIFNQDPSVSDNPLIQSLKSKYANNEGISEEDLIYLIDSVLCSFNDMKPLSNQNTDNRTEAENAVEDQVDKIAVKKQIIELLHTTKKFYGSQSKRKASTETKLLTQNPSEENVGKKFGKRKFVLSPSEPVKPAKRSKMFTAEDAISFLLIDSDDDGQEGDDATVCDMEIQEQKVTTTSLDNTNGNKPMTEDCDKLSGPNSLSQIRNVTESELNEKDASEYQYECHKDSVYNLRSAKKMKDNCENKLVDRTNMPSRIEGKCSKWKIAKLERPVTRSWQKNFHHLKHIHDSKLVCSSPKVSRHQREAISRNRKPLTRRKLTYKADNPVILNHKKENSGSHKRNEAIMETDNSSINLIPDVDDSEDLMPLDDDDDYLSESDCSSDDISVNLNMDEDPFPDFTLLPAQQKCYPSIGWEPRVHLVDLCTET